MVMDINLNDVVKLKKKHPCGANEWLVVRIGADIGLKCVACGKRVLLPRSTLRRRFKGFISRASETDVEPTDVEPTETL